MAAIICVVSLMTPTIVSAGYEEQPIKATQSDTVPVTEELLTREGDVGPASPTMKVDDTAEFLTEKPYEELSEDAEAESEGESRPWWESWFFWMDEDEEGLKAETP